MSLAASDVQLLTSLTQLLTTVILPPDPLNCGRRHERGLPFCPDPKDAQTKEVFNPQNTSVAWYGEFPWLASVRGAPQDGSSSPISVCGGVLVHPQAVLVSGACYEEATSQNLKLSLRLAEYRLNSRVDFGHPPADAEIATAVFHPDYRKVDEAVAYDVALLILKRPVQLGDAVDVVCLPWQSGLHRLETSSPNWEQQECLITGWSDPRIDFPDGIFYEKVKYLSRDTCQRLLREKRRLGPFQELHASFACIVPDSRCWADVGSALACRVERSARWTLVGQVPWSRLHQQCDTAVSVTDVEAVTDWIDTAVAAHLSAMA